MLAHAVTDKAKASNSIFLYIVIYPVTEMSLNDNLLIAHYKKAQANFLTWAFLDRGRKII
jgi:hypothetical protein